MPSHVEFRGSETISEGDRPRISPKESSISSSGNDEENSFTNCDLIRITPPPVHLALIRRIIFLILRDWKADPRVTIKGRVTFE